MKTCKPLIIFFVDPFFFCQLGIFGRVFLDKPVISFKQKLNNFVIVIVGCHMQEGTIFCIKSGFYLLDETLGESFC